MHVLVFGDSITQGYWDVEGGWVSRLRKTYDKQMLDGLVDDPLILFNLGISGDRSDEVLERFEHEVQARYSDELIIIIAVGVNDSCAKDGVFLSSPERYAGNLQKIWQLARSFTDRVMFVGLTPCIESRTTPVSWANAEYTNQRIQTFDNVLRVFCEQNKAQYTEVFGQFQARQETTELLPDGVHPNDDGHQLLTDIIGARLEDVLAANR